MKVESGEVRVLIDKVFSPQWCRENLVVPLKVLPAAFPEEQTLIVGIGNFSYLATVGDFINKRAAANGYACQITVKPTEELERILDEAVKQRVLSGEGIDTYDFSEDEVLEALKAASSETDGEEAFSFEFDDSEEITTNEEALDLSAEMIGSQIQKAAAQILIHSCRTGVSDIHIEPRKEEYKIRVRKDGVMQSYVSMPRSAGIKLTACLKNMAKMDIAERRISQDGKILRTYEGQAMEFRCSTAPAKNGEKMVMRILNANEDMLSLDTLISDEETRRSFRGIIEEANGIIIVSGPTGSGKSTTLASALREKDTGENNIVTAEDPIEYDLGGNIQQFPVVRAKGQTFANLLRTFLRQDPDVILIGETRDPETAESSMDAAETGHLVFTTLHANSAASSLTRLVDMEVPSYKLTTSLRGILAQRLLRLVCPECSIERPLNLIDARFTGLREGTPVREASALSSEEKAKRKKDETLCTRCQGSGYKGRIGSYELMKMTKNIRQAIKESKSSQEIEKIAQELDGMLTIRDYGAKLIEQQLTTVVELRKVCNTDEH